MLETLIALISEILKETSILNTLADLQRLDIFDIEAVYGLYMNLGGEIDNVISEPYDTTRLDANQMITNLLEEILEHISVSQSRSVNLSDITSKDLLFLPKDIQAKIIRFYLYAMTFRDVSILICISRNSSTATSHHEHKHTQLGEFLYKLTVVDTDIKEHKKIPYYYELDKKIYETYLNLVNSTSEEGEGVDTVAELEDLYPELFKPCI
jgi:hypothetical protein